MEESTLHYNDIVPGTVLTVGVWPYNGWPELVTAAASGNTYMVRVNTEAPEACQVQFRTDSNNITTAGLLTGPIAETPNEQRGEIGRASCRARV